MDVSKLDASALDRRSYRLQSGGAEFAAKLALPYKKVDPASRVRWQGLTGLHG